MEGESKVKSPPRSNNLRGLEKLSRDSFLISPRSFISNDQTNESPPTVSCEFFKKTDLFLILFVSIVSCFC